MTSETTAEDVTTHVVTTEPEQTTEAIKNAQKLDIGETDKWSLSDRHKEIFFTDQGRYFYSDIGGRQSANDVLCLDRGYGEPENIPGTPDQYEYFVRYQKGNAIYLSRADHNREYEYFKLEDNILTPDNEPLIGYYTEDYVYSKEAFSEEENVSIYRTDYDGKTHEFVCQLDANSEQIKYFMIYDNKVWYMSNDIFSCCDIETGEIKHFDNGATGYVNNGYIYYNFYDKEHFEHKLSRFNTKTGECEYVCDPDTDEALDKYYYTIGFYDEYLLYGDHGSVYALSDNGKIKVFDLNEYFNTPEECFYIANIQCTDGRIFVRGQSGGFKLILLEIDIDGNVIEIIHNQYDIDEMAEE